jgi:CheY-like chemotaxis protein
VLVSALRITDNQTRHAAKIERRFGQVPRVLGDDARLGQLFRNLILNAVSAIPSGHADVNRITITTSTSTVQQNTQTVVEVADTGRVMNPEHARKLFSALFSSKPIDPGVGLGLAIAHRIVHSLGGRISARSEPGIGNVFRVELPSAPMEMDLEQAMDPQPDSASSGVRRGRVLIIDDERLVLKTLARFFEPEHDTVTTTSASEALTIVAEQGPFDLIFCDLMMPNTSGMKFLSMLRDKAPELVDRVIFMTGGAFDDEAQRFLDSVQNAHVAKPFDLHAVRNLVRQRINDNDRKALH